MSSKTTVTFQVRGRVQIEFFSDLIFSESRQTFNVDGICFEGFLTDVQIGINGDLADITVRPVGCDVGHLAELLRVRHDRNFKQTQSMVDRLVYPDRVHRYPVTNLAAEHRAAQELLHYKTQWLYNGWAEPLSDDLFTLGKLTIDWEDQMKIYEAIIVRVEDKGVSATVRLEPVEIVKVIGPTLAKSAAEFSQAVLFDYGKDMSLSGKDLAGFQVRVREFQVTV